MRPMIGGRTILAGDDLVTSVRPKEWDPGNFFFFFRCGWMPNLGIGHSRPRQSNAGVGPNPGKSDAARPADEDWRSSSQPTR